MISKFYMNFPLCIKGILPEVIVSMNGGFGDISHVVNFFARTKPQHNVMYDKFCTLDRDELPACCVHTRMLNTVENDDYSICGDENEVIGTVLLNKEFYEILVISQTY